MQRTYPALLIVIVAMIVTTLGLPYGAEGQLVPNLGGQRVGISAFQSLRIGIAPRPAALGESFAAIANDASALIYNPAGLMEFADNQVLFAHAEYVVDTKLELVGGVYHLSPSDAVGASVTSLHMPEMPVTTETQPFGTGRYFTFGNVAFAATYARRMTDQFSFGVTLRYVEETLDLLKMRGVMVDMGTFYRTGLGTSRFAIVIQNFGADVSPTGNVTGYDGSSISAFQSFSPPTLFKVGFAMEPFYDDEQRVTTSLELNHPNDNAETLHLGVEYAWQRWLSLRGGVNRTIGQPLLGRDASTASDFTLGFGVSTPVSSMRVGFDYAYANFNVLGSIHRLSVLLSL